MTLPRQVEIVESHYKDAKAKGFLLPAANVYYPRKDYFIEQTIVIGVNHEI